MDPDLQRYAETEAELPILTIRAATLQEECARVLSCLYELDWFRENGYILNLPEDAICNQLTWLSHELFALIRQIATGDDDPEVLILNQIDNYPEILDLFGKEVYKPENYSEKLAEIEEIRGTVIEAFPIFQTLNKKWGFHIPDGYEVVLTEFGTWGSYFPNREPTKIIISIRTTWTPREAIIHEMVHVGVESFILKAKLTHNEKERIMDLLCMSDIFKGLLSDYKEQDIGNGSVDEYFYRYKGNLPEALAAYVTANPRE